MSDSLYTSRYRITYTPTGGTPLVLLDADDWCDGPLTFSVDLISQVEQPILAVWVTHQSRGNAQMPLQFTHYASAATRDAGQLAGIQRLRSLVERPQGELLFETAWAGPHPQIRMRMNATLVHIEWKDLSSDNMPDNLWIAMSYNFMISPLEATPA